MRLKVLLLLVALVASIVFAQVTISVVACSDNADSLKWLAEEFMKRNPDVKVEITVLSWEVLYPRILADIAAKSAAFDVFNWDVMTAGAVSQGCVDLFQFMKENPDLVDPDYDFDDLLPLARDLSIWDGKLVGFPYFNNTMLFYYRKDLFEDPKIKQQFEQMFGRPLRVPTTWAEAVDVARFFTKKYNKNSPTEYGIALMFPTTHTMFYMYLLFFGPYRRSPEGLAKLGPVDIDYGDYFTADRKPAFANEFGLKAFEDIKALLPYAPDPLGSDYGETIEYFAKGIVAMVPQWTNPYLQFASSPVLQPADKKIGIAPMPGRSVAGNWALGINAFTTKEKQRAAFRFIQFATSKWADKEKLIRFAIAPVRKSTLEDPEAQKAIPWVSALPAIYADETFRPRIPEEPKLEDVTNIYFAKILAGELPLTIETLQKLADEWERILGK
ncbi:ABC transporter substrate-binding protein [Pseudothermotoga thermarum]|uniref:Carbohydrate ABC transporter substrate-binding protein, CUT1 family n=1 Tax=Pseudothermotoga thermarum DSM 5069 TaxID=688269 RepID=F7YTI1_9THEM|nr:sugar ABC transporter substrate-binding protein [Pseudothermotoga thermarum]AEH51195.1 carbohydrate ABC transporter substrate-binding protein, CUT1 family [Pseudothermotoga thermarum DSM 5069]